MLSVKKIVGKFSRPNTKDDSPVSSSPVALAKSPDELYSFRNFDEAQAAYGRAFVNATNPLKSNKEAKDDSQKTKYTPKH